MFYTKLHTYSQTQIHELLASKQPSITASSSQSISSITTLGYTVANLSLSSFFEPPTGSTELEVHANTMNKCSLV